MVLGQLDIHIQAVRLDTDLACFTEVGSDGSAAAAGAKSLQSCLTLCDPIGSSSPASTIPGILQARVLEWVAVSFSSA